MRYQYSERVESHRYRDDGLANNIHLRIHKDSYKEVIGTLRAQNDWSRLVSSLTKYHGGLGDLFSFISVTIPECLPERLEVVAYANEYAFLYDGVSQLIPRSAASCRVSDALQIKWNDWISKMSVRETIQTTALFTDPISFAKAGTICWTYLVYMVEPATSRTADLRRPCSCRSSMS